MTFKSLSHSIVTKSTRFTLDSVSKTLKWHFKTCLINYKWLKNNKNILNVISREAFIGRSQVWQLFQIHVGWSGCGHQLLGDQWWCGLGGQTGCCGQQQPNSTYSTPAVSRRCGQDWILGRALLWMLWQERGDSGETDRSRAPGDALHSRNNRLSSPASYWSGWTSSGLWLAVRCQQLRLLTVVTPFKLGGEMGRAGELRG